MQLFVLFVPVFFSVVLNIHVASITEKGVRYQRNSTFEILQHISNNDIRGYKST